MRIYDKNLEHQRGVKEIYLNESEIPMLLKEVNIENTKNYVSGSNAYATCLDGIIRNFRFDEIENEWIELRNVSGGGGVDKEYVDEELLKKVDKVDGMGLSAVNFTVAKDDKLNGLSNYTHPASHPASMITQDSNHRFVTDAQQTSWDNKSDFDGNYDNLTNKPTIPVVDVTKKYVNDELAKKSNNHDHPYKPNTYTPSWSDITEKPIIPTKTSELTNDSSFATETFVTTKIAEANLGGGEVDLSNYATKDELNNKVDNVEGKGLSTNDFTTVEKNKLNGLNNYSHPTNAGNKHIPSGGSANQILRWSADGTAVWGNDNNTTYPACSTSTLGLTKKCEVQADSVATTLEELIADYNSLLAKLKVAGLM